jgi:hypothetical protein
MSVVIDPETKVGDLLEAFPQSEEILIGLAPKFKALRNPVLRRTVAKVATLEQAARVGGIKVSDFILALREALGVESGAVEGDGQLESGEAPAWMEEGQPAATMNADAMLSSGKTPVAESSSMLAEMGNGDILLITAEFQPAPLIDALRAKGHEVYSRTVDSGEWEVWIRKS